MAKRKSLENEAEERTEARFVVALPFVDMDVPEFSRINHKGGRIATTTGGAVSQYVFEKIQAEVIARTVLANLRDRYGGVEKYAMKVPDEYQYDDGKPMKGSDKKTAEEIEVASYFARCYGRDARKYLDETRRILKDLDRVRRRMSSKKDEMKELAEGI